MTQEAAQQAVRLRWHIAAMAGIWLLMAAWAGLADRTGCAAGLVLVMVAWALVFLAGSETALLRRHMFIRACLEPRGRVARWLGRRMLLLLWQGLKALVLALGLVIALLLLRLPQWLVLLLDILLFSALLWLLNRLLTTEIRDPYRPALARAWAHRINAALLWLGLLVSLLFTTRHDYGTLGFTEAVRHGASQVSLGCDALAILARAAAVLETALWWAAQRLFSGLEGFPLALLAWMGFIAAFGISFLVAWSWSRVLGGVMARPWHFLSLDGLRE
jgi:hypothetical protein